MEMNEKTLDVVVKPLTDTAYCRWGGFKWVLTLKSFMVNEAEATRNC